MNFRSIIMTKRNEELTENEKKKNDFVTWSYIEENKEQLDDALFTNNIIKQVCGNVILKLMSHSRQSEDDKKKQIKVDRGEQ